MLRPFFAVQANWARVALTTLALLAIVGSPSRAPAQIMMLSAFQTPGGPGANPTGQGVDEAVQNALTDFERFAERNDWQKAFRVLENLPPEKRVGMLPAGNGFLVPAKNRFWQLLAGMNAEGRSAFRLFNEPKAKQLWETLQEQQKSNDGSAAQTAVSIYDQYFMTSYGDDAANLLGDMAFERGDFAEAALRWRAVIDHHDDATVPQARLMTKCATAYVAQGRMGDAKSLLARLRTSHPTEKIVVAGKEVVAADHLEALIAARAAPKTSSSVKVDLQLTAKSLRPDWEVSFLSPKGRESLSQAVSSNSYYQSGLETLVPNHDSDGERIYLNWMGVIFAIDLTSGKLVWRTDQFSTIHNHFGDLQQGRVDLEQYSVRVMGDRVLTTALPMDRLNYWQPPIPLTAWNSKTGEKLWSLGGEQNGNVSYLGQFHPWGKGVLAISHPQQQAEMTLNYLSLDSGKAEWSMPLGSFQGKNNPYSGGMSYGMPDYAALGTQLNLMNNSGALLQINPDLKTIEGQFKLYEQETTTDGSYYYNYGYLPEEKRLHTRGRMLEKDGLLLIKEVGRSELFCLDVISQKVVWKRPTTTTAMIVDADDDFVYVMNTELSALDRETGKLRWSINLPVNGGGLSLISSGESVFVATQRGIYELDRMAGRVRQIVRVSGSDSQGISMRVIGDQLVTVTNYQVAGYRLNRSPEGGTTPSPEATGAPTPAPKSP